MSSNQKESKKLKSKIENKTNRKTKLNSKPKSRIESEIESIIEIESIPESIPESKSKSKIKTKPKPKTIPIPISERIIEIESIPKSQKDKPRKKSGCLICLMILLYILVLISIVSFFFYLNKVCTELETDIICITVLSIGSLMVNYLKTLCEKKRKNKCKIFFTLLFFVLIISTAIFTFYKYSAKVKTGVKKEFDGMGDAGANAGKKLKKWIGMKS